MQGLELLQPRRTGCKYAHTIAAARATEPEVAEAAEAALANHDVPAAKIAEFLALNGHKIARNTVGEHRSGKCCCDR